MRRVAFMLLFLMTGCLVNPAYGYWIWTPESGKWENPKYAVKDTAKEQFEWAMHFYEGADYEKAIPEFQKLVSAYPNSKYASKSQYYAARSFENREEYYRAFLEYQKAIDTYPHIDNRQEIIKREYDIGMLFFEGRKAKILGVELLPALDKAVEIFEKVITNDPYGEYADQAQFKIGETYNKGGRFGEAALAFQKLIDEYPKSELLEEAKYQIAYSSYRASKDPDYNQEMTDEAIDEFENFLKKTEEAGLVTDAANFLEELKEKKASSIFDIAEFYERQHQYASAAVYYKEVAEEYPDTSLASQALSKYTELEKKAKEIAERNALRKARTLWR